MSTPATLQQLLESPDRFSPAEQAHIYADLVRFEPLHATPPDDFSARLEPHDDAIMAALRWSRQHDPALAIRMAAQLWWHWLNLGRYADIIAWADDLLALPAAATERDASFELRHAKIMAYVSTGQVHTANTDAKQLLAEAKQAANQLLQARMEYMLGRLAYNLGDQPATLYHLEQAGRMYDALAMPREIIHAESLRGNLLCDRGEFATSQAIFERCLELAQSINFSYGLVRSLSCLAQNALYSGDAPAAQRYAAEAVEITQARGVAISLGALQAQYAMAAFFAGDAELGARTMEIAVADDRARQQSSMLTIKLGDLAHIYAHQQRIPEALAVLREGLALLQAVQFLAYLPWYFDKTVYVCAQLQRYSDAARCAGWAEAMHKIDGFPRPVLEQQAFVAAVEQLRSQLGPAEFTQLFEQGQTLDQASAIQALEQLLAALELSLAA